MFWSASHSAYLLTSFINSNMAFIELQETWTKCLQGPFLITLEAGKNIMLFLSLPFQCCVYKEKRAPITMYVDIYVKLIRELGGGRVGLMFLSKGVSGGSFPKTVAGNRA